MSDISFVEKSNHLAAKQVRWRTTVGRFLLAFGHTYGARDPCNRRAQVGCFEESQGVSMHRLLITLALSAALTCSSAPILAGQPVATFQSDQFRFEISYPPTWAPASSSRNAVFLIHRLGGQEASVISVHVARFTGNRSELMQRIRSDADKYVERTKSRFPDASMVSHGETNLGSQPAYVYNIRYTVKSFEFEGQTLARQIFCLRGDYMYQLKLEMTPPSKQTDAEFRAIAASFNFR